MRCLSCKYELSNLTEHRCPECGREFDPNDPATFLVHRESIRGLVIRAMIILVCSYIVSYLFAYNYLLVYNERVATGWSTEKMLSDAAWGGLRYLPVGLIPVLLIYWLLTLILMRRKRGRTSTA